MAACFVIAAWVTACSTGRSAGFAPRRILSTSSPARDVQLRELQETANVISQQIRVVSASTERDIDTVFVTLVQHGANALYVANDPFLLSRRDQIVALTARHALPTIYVQREYVAAGGLMSYGTSLAEAYHRAGVYAGKILKGAKPADLAVAATDQVRADHQSEDCESPQTRRAG